MTVGQNKKRNSGQKTTSGKKKRRNSGQKTTSVCVCWCVCVLVCVCVCWCVCVGVCVLVCWCVLVCVGVFVCVLLCVFGLCGPPFLGTALPRDRPSAGPPFRGTAFCRTPSRRTALRRTALRRTTQHVALFFPLRPPVRSFSLSLGVFSWNFGGVFEGRHPLMCTFGVLGLSCEDPAALGPNLRGPTLRSPSSMFFLSRLSLLSCPNVFFVPCVTFYFVPNAFFLSRLCFFCPVAFFCANIIHLGVQRCSALRCFSAELASRWRRLRGCLQDARGGERVPPRRSNVTFSFGPLCS